MPKTKEDSMSKATRGVQPTREDLEQMETDMTEEVLRHLENMGAQILQLVETTAPESQSGASTSTREDAVSQMAIEYTRRVIETCERYLGSLY